nr:chemotaxis protein CheB [Gammaproteobacteria bacterium]
EAQDHESICDKVIYFAPGGYHLLVESDRTLTLSRDDPVEFSRPSIDVLFESAADAYESTLIGVLLTGANHDGAEGIASIYDQGGVTIAEDPDTAVMATMPQSAIDTGKVHQILPLDRMANYISSIVNQPNGSAGEE